MSKLINYLSNPGPFEKTLEYLRTQHGVCASLIDQAEIKQGSIDSLPFSKVYTIDFEKEIEMLHCSAESKEALDAAEPHILMCIELIQEILIKDLILNQASDEMLELSTQLHFLYSLANKLLGVHDLREYCSIVLGEIARAVNADNAIFKVQGTCREKDILVLYKISEMAATRLEKDPNAGLLFKGKTIAFTLQDQTSALVAPIKESESQVGFIAFFRSSEKRFFTSYEKKFLAIIDDIISPNIESLRLYNSLHLLYRNTVKALASAIDAKDAYTHGHSFRVAKYALSIGRKMCLEADQLSDLEIAAYMHDLGKIGIPEAILGKAGRLTPQEFEEVKKHPIITDHILEAIDLPTHIVNGAVQHHERLDGRGYPHGLVGDAISLFGRIIAVADVFDALTTDRQYRGAMTVEASLTILCDGIDTEYDKNVVLALVSALQDGEDIEMSKIYPSLKFLKIDQMNDFLKNLINILLSEKNRLSPRQEITIPSC